MFSTLVNVHGVYRKNITSDPSFKIHYERLFDDHGWPVESSWKKIAATIIDTDNSCGVFQYHVADCVGYMKKHLKSAAPLEAGFWCYTAKKPERIFTLD